MLRRTEMLRGERALDAVPTSEDDFAGSVGSDDYWSSAFYPRGFTQTGWECTNFPEPVRALVTSGDTIIAGGPFTHVADKPAPGVAIWDGARWSGLGPDSLPVNLRAMTVYRGRIVVAGYPGSSQGSDAVFEWIGDRWSPLGAPGLGGSWLWVRGLTIYQGDLLAGGSFSVSDSAQDACVARWDGTRWQTMGTRLNLSRGNAYTFCEHEGTLFAGGYFRAAAGTDTLESLARWDGSEWQAVPGLDRFSWVSALKEFQGELIVAGVLHFPGNPRTRHAVARWNGKGLIPCDTGFPDGEGSAHITSFCTGNGRLWAAGNYSTDFTIEPLLASYQDGVWTDERPSTRSCWGRFFTGIAPYRDGFVLTGYFNVIEGAYVGHIAYRDAAGWHPIGPSGAGVEGIYCFLPSEEGLYAGGSFLHTTAGEALPDVARWDGSAWHGVGDLKGAVGGLTWYSGRLVAGGSFRLNGAADIYHIAEWDGTRWTPFPQQPSGPVFSLQVYQGDLYAGGDFWKVEDLEVAQIARWDGSEWHALGLGARGDRDQVVTSLAVYGGDLIVAGDFYRAGTVSVPGIARWDGSQWGALGQPSWTSDDAATSGLVVWDGKLVASGMTHGLDPYGGVLSEWDGFRWSDVPIPMFDRVTPLCVYKGMLAVSGDFPGLHGRRELLALWDGRQVHRLGSGVHGDWMNTAVAWNDGLCLGGEFRIAGDKASRNIAYYSGGEVVERDFSPARLEIGPNPIREATTIVIRNPRRDRVRLDVIDVVGRNRATLWDGSREAGDAVITWTGRDRHGNLLPSGIYYLRMESRAVTICTKQVLIIR